jgi:hypothetical protein
MPSGSGYLRQILPAVTLSQLIQDGAAFAVGAAGAYVASLAGIRRDRNPGRGQQEKQADGSDRQFPHVSSSLSGEYDGILQNRISNRSLFLNTRQKSPYLPAVFRARDPYEVVMPGFGDSIEQLGLGGHLV